LTTQRSIYLAPTGLGNAPPDGLGQVDWRGRGGYVVAPPSRHASGHPYQWVTGRDLDTPLAEIPAPLRARLEHRAPQRSVGSVELAATGVDWGDRYGRAALAQELARVATAPVGQRNRQLWSRPATSTTWPPPAPSTTAKSTRDYSGPPNAAASSLRNPVRPTGP
jgi:Bifunctional DNA primase/polymerase, N-terminal